MTASALGLDLDPIRPTMVTVDDGGVETNGFAAFRVDFPPSFLLPLLGGGSVALDHRWPARPEGTGVLSAQEPSGARVPMAYAWEILHRDQHAKLPFTSTSTSKRGVRSIEALGSAAARMVLAGSGGRVKFAAQVVPNSIDEPIQEDLLREAKRGLRAAAGGPNRFELVWRPVAAALTWIQRFGASLELKGGRHHQAIGSLLHLHLGVEALEATFLELVPHVEAGVTWLLPGRRTPRSMELLTGVPAQLLEQLAERLFNVPDEDARVRRRRAWCALWVSSFVEMLGSRRESPAGGASALPPWLDPDAVEVARNELMQRFPHAVAQEDRWIKALRPDPSVPSPASVDGWLTNVKLGFRDRSDLLGTVVTGPLAAVADGAGETLGMKILHRLSLGRGRLLMERVDERSLLARGACLYAARRIAEEPTYLDTLPMVFTIAMRMGEPVWENLLESEEPWVIGGRTWKSIPQKVRFQIDRGQENLELVVHREGALTCRKVGVQFQRTTEKACPVELSIELEPGQGNPRIQVLPSDRSLFGKQALYLDWATATDTGKSPKEELSNVERVCPPHEPRLANRDRWLNRRNNKLSMISGTGVRALILDYLKYPSSWTVDGQKNFTYLNNCLKEQKQILDDQISTAVSSDGEVIGGIGDEELLRRFLELVARRLQQSGSDNEVSLVRLLGSASAQASTLLDRLRTFLVRPGLRRYSHSRKALLWACGNCLRKPEDLSHFFSYFDQNFPDYAEAQALAHILMYREKALEHVESARAEAWVKKLLPLIKSERALTGRNLALSRSVMAVAYLLRRRCFDASFLSPDSPTAKRLREAVQLVIREPRPFDTPGTVRIIEALKKVEEYLNRKGRGRLTALMVEEDGEGDDS